MKTIGLIGGMSWESSAEYYRILNETIKQKLGGLHSAQCLLYSVDFGILEALMRVEKWEETTEILIEAAHRLEVGGAEVILLCTNTMHRVADQIQEQIHTPFLHIVDPTAEAIHKQNLKKVGLLGTRFVMEKDFYKKRFEEKYLIEILVPAEEERESVHNIIFQELCLGILNPISKQIYLNIIQNLIEKGAEGIILGCTEIGLLIQNEDCNVPLFDTAKLHAISAVEFALTP